jgi:hypothetical protein
MLIKLKGIIEFSPEDVTRKHKSQSSWKRIAIIKTDCDLDKYYAWFLKKRFNLELNPNLRGSHITFISDKLEKSIFDEASKIFNNKEIDFYLELEPKSSVGHWWLRAFSPDAENIREVMGLSRDPYFGLHLTLGNVKKTDVALAHSEYILNQCKRFELISSEPRKSIDEYEIIDFTK